MGLPGGRAHRLIPPVADLLPAFVAALGRVDPPVVVACSGGPDSLSLLALAVAADLSPVAVHVDHGARPGSAAEAGVVADAATALGAGFAGEAVCVPPGPNFEARARDARYEALERARERVGATVVLVGHTQDDQAESVLINLLRGGAVPGLAGIPPRRGTIRRPLLGVPRSVLRQVCAAAGLDPLVDPMNADVAHRRVWVRRELLPSLEAGAGRDLRALLARQADVARAESDLLDRLAAGAFEDFRADPVGDVLTGLDPAIARRTVRLWLGSPPVTLAHVEGVLDVAAGRARSVDLPGGRRVVRSRGRLSLVDGGGGAAAPAGPVALELPGTADGFGLRLEAWVERAAPVRWPDGRWTAVFDADEAGPVATLRTAGKGERFVPLGTDGHKSVAHALAEAGVPPERRSSHPVLAGASGNLLWVLGYRIDDRVRVRRQTRRFLWVSAETGGLRV